MTTAAKRKRKLVEFSMLGRSGSDERRGVSGGLSLIRVLEGRWLLARHDWWNNFELKE